MYISPINYQPKIALNYSTRQNNNVNFAGRGKTLAKNSVFILPTIPLVFNHFFSKI